MQNQYPEIFIQLIASIVIASLLLGFVVVIFKLYQKKKNIQEKELESIRIKFEKELLQTRIEIQEDTLKNISMEIHDNIGQVMLLANINTSILQSMNLPQEASKTITETKKLISKAIEDISELSRGLHPDRIFEKGVFSTIIYELELLERKGLFQVIIQNTIPENISILSKPTQLIIFRMFQEISKNILKHAKATKVELLLSKKGNTLQMQITDNGVGFGYSSSELIDQEYDGIGIRSLKSRAGYFNGSVSIKSVLQKGTSISIFIPLSDDR